MSFWEIIILSVALAMDAAAVSIAAGLKIGKVTARQIFRISFHFGLFQFGMTAIGCFLGKSMAGFFSAVDHWVALVLLSGIGGKMLWENFTDQPEKMTSGCPTRGKTLIMLSIATSIDALAAGVGLAVINVPIWPVSITIGVITCAMSAAAVRYGGRLGVKWEHRSEVIGGVVLIAIGLKIFIDHIIRHI